MSLPWIRLDVGFLRNPKLVALRQAKQHRAIVLHLGALLYAGEQGTDGYLTRDVVRELGGRPSDVQALEEVCLWFKDGEDGWVINGWKDKQETSTEAEARSNRMRSLAHRRHGTTPKD